MTKKGKTVEYEVIPPAKVSFTVGIDPSYSSTGFVLLKQGQEEPIVATTIKAGRPHEHFFSRMEALLTALSSLLHELPKDETFICMEGSSFASQFNVFKLGKLSGVIEYWLGVNGYCYNLVAPTYLKKVATGSGNATKLAVIRSVHQRWGFQTYCDDVADAYTLAQIARGALPVEPTHK